MKETESFVSGRAHLIEKPDSILIPLALCRASCGFPSPADDYIEKVIDLNQELIRHPFSTFLVRAEGDSMIDAGILDESVLIVDRMVEAQSGDIVVARIGDEMCVKELFIDDAGKVLLMPKNENYKPIEITAEMDFEVWGKVICSITKFE
ncbi:MAG TPA: translesion error-prone DNA polymerase V autoproteolytic subunit [Pyrinomonadaceae bacterium]|jgi:DNA polymerase V